MGNAQTSEKKSREGHVFVAMSGGVDSSVAALLLQRAGYTVTGVTFKLYDNEDLGESDERLCCSRESVYRARRVCDKLSVPQYTFDLRESFRKFVIERFVNEYVAGRTPNPCVLCNRHLKFEIFLQRALALGAEYVATGHHARIFTTPAAALLLPGSDAAKDQSYALCHLNQTTMPHVLLPVGDLTKGEVRRLAQEAGLPTAETPESQDICFVRDEGYAEFLARQGVVPTTGPIITREGRVLGRHRGLHHYTVGQRKGLDLSPDGPWFVAEKRVIDNALVVVGAEELRQHDVVLEDVNWCDGSEGGWPKRWPEGLQVMLRYRSRLVACAVTGEDVATRRLQLRLESPMVVAPGQYGVLYDGGDGHVVAGGVIGN